MGVNEMDEEQQLFIHSFSYSYILAIGYGVEADGDYEEAAGDHEEADGDYEVLDTLTEEEEAEGSAEEDEEGKNERWRW